MENKINFVRKIKIRIVNEDKDLKNEQYQRLRNIQYHSWKLANKIVQGQFFIKILPDVILFKYPDQYKRYKEIQGRLTDIGLIKKKNINETILQEKSNLYLEINELKKVHEDEFKDFIKNQTIQNYTYSSNADEYRDIIPSYIRTSLNRKVYQEFNTKYNTFLNGSTSIQTYKKNLAIPFQKTAIRDFRLNENNEFNFEMFDIKFECLLGKDGNNTRYILNDLVNKNEQFKFGDPIIQIGDEIIKETYNYIYSVKYPKIML